MANLEMQQEKIFLVSFHKSASSSMHEFFIQHGLTSCHCPVKVNGVNYAKLVSGIPDSPGEIVEAFAPVINSFQAHCDIPWGGLVPELLACYPNSRFIFVKREPNGWWESLKGHWRLDICGRYLSIFEYIQYRRYISGARVRLFTRKDKQLFLDAFKRHEQLVAEVVPKSQLLVVDIEDKNKSRIIADFLGLREAGVFPHVVPISQRRQHRRVFGILCRRLFKIMV